MEVIIAILIVLLAIYLIIRSFKKSSKGECNCGSCSKGCPKYEANKDNVK